jgi:hypothetical protein
VAYGDVPSVLASIAFGASLPALLAGFPLLILAGLLAIAGLLALSR